MMPQKKDSLSKFEWKEGQIEITPPSEDDLDNPRGLPNTEGDGGVFRNLINAFMKLLGKSD